jgi:hypothetical protein
MKPAGSDIGSLDAALGERIDGFLNTPVTMRRALLSLQQESPDMTGSTHWIQSNEPVLQLLGLTMTHFPRNTESNDE